MGFRVYSGELGVGVVELGVRLGQEDALGLDHLFRFRVLTVWDDCFQAHTGVPLSYSRDLQGSTVTGIYSHWPTRAFLSPKISAAYIECSLYLFLFRVSIVWDSPADPGLL